MATPIFVVTFGLGLILLPVLAIIPWFLKDNVYWGHWYYSVENRWDLHESAFSSIFKRLNEKATPAKIEPRLLSSSVANTPRYYLSMRQGRHVAYISVLTYGADLSVSWTMWREERPLSVWWNYLKESIARLFGKGNAFYELVRHDHARAMRETVHNAARAGVDDAVAGANASIIGTFGHELPIESTFEQSALNSAPAQAAADTTSAPDAALNPPVEDDAARPPEGVA